MLVVVHLPAALRTHGGGAAQVAVEVAGPDATVDAVLDVLAIAHPGVGRRIRDERGALRPHVHLFLGRGGDFQRARAESAVPHGAELMVLPAVSGGA